jgi:hypothetical protein
VNYFQILPPWISNHDGKLRCQLDTLNILGQLTGRCHWKGSFWYLSLSSFCPAMEVTCVPDNSNPWPCV